MSTAITPAIRAMTRADLDRAIEWAAAEGWNPGLADGDAFYAADPGGFLMATVDGAPAACISVVRYGVNFGFLGFYIARPEWRGRGVGFALWQAGMARLEGRVVGLDGVVAQQDNYRKSGFAFAHRDIRHEGVVTAAAPRDPRLVRIDARHLAAIQAYDRGFFAAPRDGFVADWTAKGGRTAFALVDGALRGYGVIRACRRGHKIGPLFAETPAEADLLFRALAATVPGETVILDPPEPNAEALALAARHGLQPSFETARMYRGSAPALPLERTYGITTMELG